MKIIKTGNNDKIHNREDNLIAYSLKIAYKLFEVETGQCYSKQ